MPLPIITKVYLPLIITKVKFSIKQGVQKCIKMFLMLRLSLYYPYGCNSVGEAGTRQICLRKGPENIE